MPSNQKEIIKQAKSKYSPLAKSFKKQTKTNEKQREKQIKTVEGQGEQRHLKKDLKKKF